MQPTTAETAQRLGPIRLSAGIAPRNAMTFFYAAFSTIGLISVVGFLQPYLLSENLGLDPADEGRISSVLQVSYELVVLLAVGPLGALADKIGRRPIWSIGFLWLGASFVVFPLVETLPQLVACRMFFGIGTACCTCMMATVLADYPQHRSRGVMAAGAGISNGLGALTMVILLSQLPTVFAEAGYTTRMSGQLTYWLGAVLAFITAGVVFRGLKAGKPGKPLPRASLARLLLQGTGAARRNPRILLVCAEAFVARGDLVVFSTFFSLWARQAGMADGLQPGVCNGRCGPFCRPDRARQPAVGAGLGLRARSLRPRERAGSRSRHRRGRLHLGRAFLRIRWPSRSYRLHCCSAWAKPARFSVVPPWSVRKRRRTFGVPCSVFTTSAVRWAS